MQKAKSIIFVFVTLFLGIGNTLLAQVTTTLVQGKPLERELKGGESQSFSVTIKEGEFLRASADQRGIDVVVRLFDPSGTKMDEADTDDHGPETVAGQAKVAGLYRIEVESFDKEAKPGHFEIKIDEVLSPVQYSERLAKESVKREVVTKWLAANAVTVKTVEAGNGSQDLQPLKRSLRDAQFVGLGEETHGTREFFQFKHRMLEFLVKEMGYRVFAMEASYAGCRNMNDYIMGVTNDGAKALASQGFWTWNTEEVLAMLDWMRSYNASVPADKKVKFVGFDIQINHEARDTVLAYIKRVAPDRAPAFEQIPVPKAVDATDAEAALSIETIVDSARRSPESLSRLKEIIAKYNELIGFMSLNEPTFVRKTSRAEFDDALHSLRVVAQYIDAYYGNRVELRDAYMADNFRRFTEAEPAGTKFLVWAHNGHISADGGSLGNFGSHLRRYFGNRYYAVGFSFNKGGFQSREMDLKLSPKRMLTGYVVGPGKENSIDTDLARIGKKTFFIDLHAPARDSAVTEWLTTPHPMRSIGSGFSVADDLNFYQLTTPNKSFDGLFFVDTTSRARPNPGIKNVAPVQ